MRLLLVGTSSKQRDLFASPAATNPMWTAITLVATVAQTGGTTW